MLSLIAAGVSRCPGAGQNIIAGAIVIVAECLREAHHGRVVTRIGCGEHGGLRDIVTSDRCVFWQGLHKGWGRDVGRTNGLIASGCGLISAVVDGDGGECPDKAERSNTRGGGVVVHPCQFHIGGSSTAIVGGGDLCQTEGLYREVGGAIVSSGDHHIFWAGHFHHRWGVVVELDELLEHVCVSAIIREGVGAHVHAHRLHATTGERGVEERHRDFRATGILHLNQDVLGHDLVTVLLTGEGQGHVAVQNNRSHIVKDGDGLLHQGLVATVVHKGPRAVHLERACTTLVVEAVLHPAPSHIGVEVVGGAEFAISGVSIVLCARQGHVFHAGHGPEVVDQSDHLLAGCGIVTEVHSSEGPGEGHGAFSQVIIGFAIDHEVRVHIGDVDLGQVGAIVGGHSGSKNRSRGVTGKVLVHDQQGICWAGDFRGHFVKECDVLLGQCGVATIVLSGPDAHPASWTCTAQRPCFDGDGDFSIAVVEGLDGHLSGVKRVGQQLTRDGLIRREVVECRSRLIHSRDGLNARQGVADVSTGVHRPCLVGALKAVAAIGAAVGSITQRSGWAIAVRVEGRWSGVAPIFCHNRGHTKEALRNICCAILSQDNRRVGRAFEQGNDRCSDVLYSQDLCAAGLCSVAAVVR